MADLYFEAGWYLSDHRWHIIGAIVGVLILLALGGMPWCVVLPEKK
jgi:uncharacterized membrane protein